MHAAAFLFAGIVTGSAATFHAALGADAKVSLGGAAIYVQEGNPGMIRILEVDLGRKRETPAGTANRPVIWRVERRRANRDGQGHDQGFPKGIA